MPSLADLQQAMGQALLAREVAGRALPAEWFDGDASAGLKVHRNTIIGACCTALRLCYPTLERVLGAPLFEACAAEFARAHPPTAPALDEYGSGFGEFVVTRAAAADAALLRELAAYDWLFEQVAHAASDDFGSRTPLQLAGGARLQLAGSLRLFETRYAIAQMRAGHACDTTPAEPRTLALWRRAEGVAVAALRAPAAAFVARLLHGASLAAALAAAGEGDAAATADIIAADVLQAGFVRITAGEEAHGYRSEH